MEKTKQNATKDKNVLFKFKWEFIPSTSFWHIPTPLFLSFLAFYLKDNENCGDLDTKCKL